MRNLLIWTIGFLNGMVVVRGHGKKLRDMGNLDLFIFGVLIFLVSLLILVDRG